MPVANRCQAEACHDGLHFRAIVPWPPWVFVPPGQVFWFISIE